MIIRWLDDAIHDLQSLRHYITQDNSVAAIKVVKKILRAIDGLSEQPSIGRHGRVTHTRELIVLDTPYIVPYRVKNNEIQILRIFHCAMQWPEDFEE
jgi:toxin ParE1/3/4